jgi:hypothetical protein
MQILLEQHGIVNIIRGDLVYFASLRVGWMSAHTEELFAIYLRVHQEKKKIHAARFA